MSSDLNSRIELTVTNITKKLKDLQLNIFQYLVTTQADRLNAENYQAKTRISTKFVTTWVYRLKAEDCQVKHRLSIKFKAYY